MNAEQTAAESRPVWRARELRLGFCQNHRRRSAGSSGQQGWGRRRGFEWEDRQTKRETRDQSSDAPDTDRTHTQREEAERQTGQTWDGVLILLGKFLSVQTGKLFFGWIMRENLKNEDEDEDDEDDDDEEDEDGEVEGTEEKKQQDRAV